MKKKPPKITLNAFSVVVSFFFLVMLVWWFYIAINQLEDTTPNFLYGAAEGFLPFIAGLFGLINAKRWGLFRSSVGRSIFFLSAGLITWGIGTIVFAYYNLYLQIAVPYPSLADAFYIISWPLWVISMFNLSRATGVKFQLRSLIGRSLLFVIPALSIIASYYFLIVVAREGVLIGPGSTIKTFFDLAYPIGDVVILTTALLIFGLSFNYLGGYYKWPIIVILAGFVMNYVGDFFFVFSTTKGTYFVGDWVDLIYTITFFLLGLGACLMDPRLFSRHSSSKIA